MNIVEVIILVILLICAWSGYRRGFLLSALVLVSWLTALILAFLLYHDAGTLLLKLIPKAGNWSSALSFIIILLLAQAVFDGLSYWLLTRLPQRIAQSRINLVLGILPGLVNGYIWAALLAAFLLTYPLDGSFTRDARKSKLARQMANNTGWLNERLSPVFSNALLHLQGNDTTTVSHERTVNLPFKLMNARPRPDLEAEMLRLVNKERTRRGLQPLQADKQLTILARGHSDDMLRRGYFSHYTPEGFDPFDRMKQGHVHFLTAGENIAITQTLPMAHTGLMKSPGHRANILNPAFGRLGIGILDAGRYGLMITQAFRN